MYQYHLQDNRVYCAYKINMITSANSAIYKTLALTLPLVQNKWQCKFYKTAHIFQI